MEVPEVSENIPEKSYLIKKVGDLKVLPFVARKMLDTMGDENCSLTDLGEIIEKDQILTARVLKISNSAMYGLRQQVTSLQHALMILGLKTIRSLVLSVSTRSLYKKFGMTEKIIWDHSVGAAIASKIISKGLGTEVEDVSFIGGLMHDMGKVVLNNETPEVFTKVMMNIYNRGESSLKAENDMYGYNHSEIGSLVVKKWGFPEILTEILEKHHLNVQNLSAIESPLVAKSIACVNLADRVCKFLGIGYRNHDNSITLHELPSAIYLGFTKEKMDALAEEIHETYESEKSLFD
jgi:putative nucleotidyltransferase with HDIG domain